MMAGQPELTEPRPMPARALHELLNTDEPAWPLVRFVVGGNEDAFEGGFRLWATEAAPTHHPDTGPEATAPVRVADGLSR
jgi:hypothetical protein